MRIALVSSIKRSVSGEMLANADLAGRSVLSWQIKHALEAQCERIICLCDAPAPHILEQQHLVEGRRLDFHTVRSPSQIGGLVRDDDDVLMQLDGLIIADNAMADVLSDGFAPNIQTLASDHMLVSAHPDDFERIDRDRNWAGLAIIPGACVSALEDLPSDGDAMSLLLRLGLQVRVPAHTVSEHIVRNNQWFLASDLNAIAQRQVSMLEAAIAPSYWTGPGGLLATTLVRAVGTGWFQSGTKITQALSTILMILAAVLAAFGYTLPGLGVAAFASFIAQVTLVLTDLQTRIWKLNPSWLALKYYVPLTLALGLLVIVLAHLPASGIVAGVAIPLIAVGMASIAGRGEGAASRAFWRDTPTHFVFFCVSAGFGFLTEALLVFALGALLQLMLRPDGKSDRTS